MKERPQLGRGAVIGLAMTLALGLGSAFAQVADRGRHAAGPIDASERLPALHSGATESDPVDEPEVGPPGPPGATGAMGATGPAGP